MKLSLRYHLPPRVLQLKRTAAERCQDGVNVGPDDVTVCSIAAILARDQFGPYSCQLIDDDDIEQDADRLLEVNFLLSAISLQINRLTYNFRPK